MTASGEPSKAIGSDLFNVFRGALMGAAEVIPGVSGGTVALVVGIYDRLIISAGHTVSGVRLAATDLPRGKGGRRAAEEFRNVHWRLVLAVLAGMFAAVIVAAKLVAPLVESHPEHAFGLFFGLVLASLYVPYMGSGRRWTPANYLLALVVAAGAFVLTGLPPTEITDPHPLIIVGAAAVAITALVLPGVSGSFMLLAFGLYTVTINAVNERDFGYLGLFALGAVLGLAFFVKLLQWLLEHHHHLTLVVMTGLLAGSLRALWPWQPWEEERRILLAPSGDVLIPAGMLLLGMAIVIGVLLVERRRTHSANARPRTTVEV